ncbi:bifunctional 2-polyprenyl-6-hydroxyphenol methylase/3-demethylubiquinol 3-O-methyltransferase UbiG [Microseira sp. BLCC-F43]|jgi:2-polyprenyl-6-hydroxyphenyl methylase/3-demethylubiquinone-9 3-methyltransferase|uniref:bifunctional 2-polyprenyl-6-hydroxyphenol methylase/3-demethylubiquinol 3-O-methyltransferase UbiG n=1 Tax=Microseira sp. BLCC-F43 TaxID=3153602 RepID=UPI0035B9A417
MKKNNLEFYDLYAERWWNPKEKVYTLYHINKPRFEFFDRYVSNWQGLKALDVGCGGGFSCEFMAARGVLVSGIDQSAKCIQAAQKHAESSGFKIDYRQAVAENIPYGDATFDVVVCVDVLEHVENVEQVISEVYRVLKPDGLFLFDTINRTFKSKLVMIWLLENILRQIERGVHDWNKFIQPEELTEWLQAAGFKNIDIKGFDIFGDGLKLKLFNYINYWKTGVVPIKINEDDSINYIGKAVK